MPFQKYTISAIGTIVEAESILHEPLQPVNYLLTDSRKLASPEGALFFALSGNKDGHQYIRELYEKGVRNFVISNRKFAAAHPEANFLIVQDTITALQQLAVHHRKQFKYPVIGITGSNGKTIVKEWLFQLLAFEYSIIRNPKSYNSQSGVPLSVWNMSAEHELALFEAGISMPGEMEKLEAVIRPDIGILTNIGTAHDEGFKNREQKIAEKLKLFKNVGLLICNPDYLEGYKGRIPGRKTFTWALKGQADLVIREINRTEHSSLIRWEYAGEIAETEIPFTDAASVENAISCISLMLCLNYEPAVISARMSRLQPVAMRLDLRNAINNCSLINDSYSSDLASLSIALDFLAQQHQHPKKTVILSDIFQSGKADEQLYKEVADLLRAKKVNRIVGIGERISSQAGQFGMEKEFYPDTASFIENLSGTVFHNETILLKGARVFEFEKISRLLEQKVHETVLEINLNAMVHNLNVYRSHLEPGTKIMAMVKAFSYGSGSFEIANLLQFHRVDYLGVAYADEGTDLRKAGITMPILVMSPEESGFNSIFDHSLEPQLYSFRILQLFIRALKDRGLQEYPIHIKIDTGMKRLGFEEKEIEQLIELLVNSDEVRVASVFSHLAASDESEHDDFTRQQISLFNRLSERLITGLGYSMIRHMDNTAAILRFPEAQYDMVRLGIGLYGIDSSGLMKNELINVGTLKTTITQVKELNEGETVGYGRQGKANGKRTIATIKIGYADGYSRLFSKGKGYVMIRGQKAPVIGNVCMDMTMVDITGIPSVREGDEVIVFGEKPTISELSSMIGAIPYEILTAISQRVKRIYYYE